MKKQKSYYPKPLEVDRKWIIVDAQDKILGRLASYVAGLARGKYRPDFTPSVDQSDFIIVINTDKICVTGKKLTDKFYYHHTGYPGGLKSISLRDSLKKDSAKVVYEAIRGMLPHNKLSRQLLKRIRLYRGSEHPHVAQMPTQIEIPSKEL